MKFKRLFFLVCLIPLESYSSTGTVNFEGNISQYTCEISDKSKNLTVNLPTMSTSSFNGVGKHGGYTKFNIDIENCNAKNVRFYVDRLGTNVHSNGIAIIPEGNNTSIGVGLYYPELNSFLSLDTNTAINYAEVDNGKASLEFTAAYLSLATITEPGPVKAIMKYRLEYD